MSRIAALFLEATVTVHKKVFFFNYMGLEDVKNGDELYILLVKLTWGCPFSRPVECIPAIPCSTRPLKIKKECTKA
jgi:hypothetical protein